MKGGGRVTEFEKYTEIISTMCFFISNDFRAARI